MEASASSRLPASHVKVMQKRPLEPGFQLEASIENDVAVERAADSVGYGVIVVVAVDEDGKNAGDRALALFAGSRALKEPWQIAEDAWRGRSASSSRR